MDKFLYELKTSFLYASGGNQIEAGFIELSPPTTKNLGECSFLKQAVFKTMTAASENLTVTDADREAAIKSGGDTFKGSEIMALLNASTTVELSAVLGTARALFTSKGSIAMVDGDERLTKPLCDLMDLQDLEGMTGEYLANFIIASSLT